MDEAVVKETHETAEDAAVKEIQEALERLVEKEEGRGGLLDRFVEDVAVMGELQRGSDEDVSGECAGGVWTVGD